MEIVLAASDGALAFWVVVVLVWLALALGVGHVFSEKGYGEVEGFLLAAFFSPVVGLGFAMALPDKHFRTEALRLLAEMGREGGAPSSFPPRSCSDLAAAARSP